MTGNGSPGTTGKLVVDATRPLGGFARRHTLPPDVLRRAAALLDARPGSRR